MTRKIGLKRGRSVKPLALAELISALKNDLRAAAAKSKGDKLFKVADATIDIGVRFSRGTTFGGAMGIKAEVVDIAEATHRLQVRVVPASPEEIDVIKLHDPDSPLVQGTGQNSRLKVKQ